MSEEINPVSKAKNPIYALISMLDDPDPTVYNAISENIIGFGMAAIPVLERESENSFNPMVRTRMKELIQKLNFEGILHETKFWKSSHNLDVIQFQQLLNKLFSPESDTAELNQYITGIQKKIWLELNDTLTALESIRLINHLLFENEGFLVDSSNNPEPDLFFPSRFLKSKKAYPMALGAFYLGLCQRLTLPVFYVDLPDNFILAYTSQPLFSPVFKPGEVLFYINPLLQGVIFNRAEIERFLKSNDMPSLPHYFAPSGNERVAIRLLHEAMRFSQGTGNQNMVGNLRAMLQALDDKVD